MIEQINPIYASDDTGLVHAGEAPPAGHAFYPTAHCGTVMTGVLHGELPEGADLCANDAKWLGIKQEKTSTEKTTNT